MLEQPALYKRLYLYMRNIVGHGWDTFAFWVATVYSVWAAVTPLEIQRRAMLAVHVDPDQRLVIWGFGLAAFFLYAGFRAWDEEHAALEKSSEGAAVKELRRLQEREWPRLTDSQRAELVARLKQIGANTIWIVRPSNLDCVALANDFHGAFKKAEWDVPHQPYSIEQQRVGITIRSLIKGLEESLENAINETTKLPATTYSGRPDGPEGVIVLSIGPKEPSV